MIPLAISNIAWSPERQGDILSLLRDLGVTGIEIAPGLAFPHELDPFDPDATAVDVLMQSLEAHGLQLVSMQSLLFGVEGAKLFGDNAERDRFSNGLRRAIQLAGRLGISNLVMGAPGNRNIPDGMTREEAEAIAIEVFRDLGQDCLDAGTKLALEPNPPEYKTNFMNTVDETVAIVRKVDHPAVTLNFDLGAVTMNGLAPIVDEVWGRAADLVSHIHISEPQLGLAPADASSLERIARSIVATGYRGWFSIEMRKDPDDEVSAVRLAVTRARAALGAAFSRARA